jgi:uncharacterized membrane protein YhhN
MLWVVATVAFTFFLVVAEWYAKAPGATPLAARNANLGKWLTKPFASLAFVALALHSNALECSYGRVILCGLVLAAIGDVLLLLKSQIGFQLGILAFLLGHIAFCVAFFSRGISLPALEGVAFITTIAGLAVGRWLWPYAGKLKGAVVAYILVSAAVATHMARSNPMIALGAILFFVSDLSVARDRFIKEEFTNKLWGLPMYYAAEVLLALSIHNELPLRVRGEQVKNATKTPACREGQAGAATQEVGAIGARRQRRDETRFRSTSVQVRLSNARCLLV